MAETRNDFSQGGIKTSITRLAIPMIVAQLINVLYNIVDRMYVGHIPGEGMLPLTGLGITFPIITIITAFTNLCGQGGAPLCSIERGAGNNEKAERIMGNACTLLLFFCVIVTAASFIFKVPVLRAFGASDQTLPYADNYLTIYLCGNFFSMLGLGLNTFISAQGFSKVSMLTVGLGAVVNIVLDPLFIYAFHMGVKGAALATIISQFISMVWVLRFLTSEKAILRLRLRHMKPEPRLCGRILGLGMSNFVMSLTTSAVQIFSNTTLAQYGGDLYVGAMTVVTSVHEVALKPVQGFTSGAQPVLSFNYGAHKYERAEQCIRYMTKVCLIMCFIITALVVALPHFFVLVFNNKPELVAVSEKALRIYFCVYTFMGLQMAGQSTLVSLGMSKQAIFFSLLRKAVIVVPLTIILPRTAMGVWGVFWADPISCVTACVACFVTMLLTVVPRLRKMEALEHAEPDAE